jgi:hypothetical protein
MSTPLLATRTNIPPLYPRLAPRSLMIEQVNTDLSRPGASLSGRGFCHEAIHASATDGSVAPCLIAD